MNWLDHPWVHLSYLKATPLPRLYRRNDSLPRSFHQKWLLMRRSATCRAWSWYTVSSDSPQRPRALLRTLLSTVLEVYRFARQPFMPNLSHHGSVKCSSSHQLLVCKAYLSQSLQYRESLCSSCSRACRGLVALPFFPHAISWSRDSKLLYEALHSSPRGS